MVKDAAGRGYERGSASYRSARPSYHPTIIDELVRRTAGDPVVELGAGTGILTAELIAQGVDVMAVEPVEAMRQALIQVVGEANARTEPLRPFPWRAMLLVLSSRPSPFTGSIHTVRLMRSPASFDPVDSC